MKKLIHGLAHKELVKIAKRWLRNTNRCSVVLSEMPSQAEVPDAIGEVESRAGKPDNHENEKHGLLDDSGHECEVHMLAGD